MSLRVTDTRPAAIAILLASLAILATAFGFQHLGGLHPCELCIWQRWPYVATAALALAALTLAPAGRRAAIGLAGLVFLGGAGIAAFHVGVEQGWWRGLASCGGSLPNAKTVEELRAAILNQAVVRCDAVAWSLFGVSMAGWNFLLSLGLAALSLRVALPGRTDRA